MTASWRPCLLLVALVAVVVAGEDAPYQQWRSVAALRDLTRRIEGLADDAAQQHVHSHAPNAAEDKAAGGGGEKRPVVITVVGVLLAVGFLVGVAMMLRRSHGRSEERRGVRLESPPADGDGEAELGLMAGGEHEDAESEEDEEAGDQDGRDWEEKQAVRLEDKSD